MYHARWKKIANLCLFAIEKAMFIVFQECWYFPMSTFPILRSVFNFIATLIWNSNYTTFCPKLTNCVFAIKTWNDWICKIYRKVIIVFNSTNCEIICDNTCKKSPILMASTEAYEICQQKWRTSAAFGKVSKSNMK